MKTKIYEIKKGYDSLGCFQDLDEATKFFGDLVRGSGRHLNFVEKKGVKAHYWGGQVEFSIKISEVEIYPTRKEAEFAVFNGEGSEEEDE